MAASMISGWKNGQGGNGSVRIGLPPSVAGLSDMGLAS
jgi:hypothetical protein